MTVVFPKLIDATEHILEEQNITRGCCHICQRGKDRKSSQIYVKCNKSVCLEDSKSEIVCENCTNDM